MTAAEAPAVAPVEDAHTPGFAPNVIQGDFTPRIPGVRAASDAGAGQGSGPIYIRGGALRLDGSRIQSTNFGTAPGGPISVQADKLTLLAGGAILSTAAAAGRGGPISVKAGEILASQAGSTAPTGILSFVGPGSTGAAKGALCCRDRSGHESIGS